MPKLKQPASLQNMAMERLVHFCSQLCVTVSGTGDLDSLRLVVLLIKGYTAPQIPSHLRAEFYNPILRTLWSDNSELARHPLSHQEIVFEMIMDVKIAGLECEFPRLPLCLSKADRIQGLTRLTIREKGILLSLEKFHLDHLRYLHMNSRQHDTWSDEDLRMIARKCPILEHLTISGSENVTDAGLRALDQCSNLRSLSIEYYSRTSLGAMDRFLSGTGRKRDIPVYWGTRLFDDSETLVYPFIESLMLDNYTVRNKHLISIVAKFPNLRNLHIGDDTFHGNISNWQVLSGLKNLSCLELYCDSFNVKWTDLVPLLRHLGGNMRKLAIPYLDRGKIDQDKLNLIYELCPNVEYLKVSTRCTDSALVVPRFENLAYLSCDNYTRREDGVLQFAMGDGATLKLETLVVLGFDMDEKMLEMMLDHRSFPNVKKITIEKREKPTGKIDRLRRFAKLNNLDLEFDQEFWEPI